MRIASWITKANTHTHTHSLHLLRIDFQQQKRSRERATILRYTCIDSLVMNRLQTVSHSNPGTDSLHWATGGVACLLVPPGKSQGRCSKSVTRNFSYFHSHILLYVFLRHSSPV